MQDPQVRSSRLVATFVVCLVAGFGHQAWSQTTLNDQLRKVLTDPEAMKELEKAKDLAPVELFKTQILPNDVLPFIKPNHWGTMALELRSNQIDYSGSLETMPVPLEGMPQEIVYHRSAMMTKGKRTRLTLPVMIPRIPKEIGVQLKRPDTIREDELWNVPLRLLEPHQMLVPVLTKGTADAYNQFSRMRITYPLSAAYGDPVAIDRQRYYRLVLPLEPGPPQLPSHPMAWTTISHVIWDGLPPEDLSVGQQEAMLDWLHWGGQLIIVGGAGPSFEPLKESFIGPYLPAESSGKNALLTAEDLSAMSRKYQPLASGVSPEDLLEGTQSFSEAWKKSGRRYLPESAPIRVEKDKPIYLNGLQPRPGATAIPVGKAGLPPLAVEARVGRGRIIMVGINLVEPTLLAWPGYETLIRRVIFRRVEENLAEGLKYAPNGGGFNAPRYEFLAGPQLTWLRYHGRDLGAPTRRITPEDELETGRISARPLSPESLSYNPIDYFQVPVAEWLDSAVLPSLSRSTLERASGIEIPNSRFVLKVIVAYVICLVPINWLLCRFGFGRREWAWVIVPVLAFGFAIVVERAAAYDVGYESTCDEIDLLETQGDYGRGHISRFGSLYTTGRVKFSISYPDDPTALVLPMSTGRSIRGEDVRGSRFEAIPYPALTDFLIQPRSLSMFRAEQMATVPGAVTVKSEGGVRKVINGGPLELRDAVVVELKSGGSRLFPLGTIPAAGSIAIPEESTPASEYKSPDGIEGSGEKNSLSPAVFLETLVRSSQVNSPEDEGELRLIAWAPQLIPGQTLEPAVDRHRGFTLVVAHLQPGKCPDPDSLAYDALANGPEVLPKVVPVPPQNPYGMMRGGLIGGGMGGSFPAATKKSSANPKATPPPAGVRRPRAAMPIPRTKPDTPNGAGTPGTDLNGENPDDPEADPKPDNDPSAESAPQ